MATRPMMPPPPPPPTSNPMDLDMTILSAKHLKNVNWRNGGDLKPYAIFWVDPERRLATKPDESGSTKPVWNEQFTLPITYPFEDSQLTIEIFHSKPSETPKPLVGTARIHLNDLFDSLDDYDYSVPHVHTLELFRPSGRAQGKVKVKIAVRARPIPPPPPPQQPSGFQEYNFAPQSGYYYSSGSRLRPPPPDYRHEYSSPAYEAPPPFRPPPPSMESPYGYSAPPYSGYPCYPSYYSHPPPGPPQPSPQMQPQFRPPPQPQGYSVSTGPSAPVDSSGYDHRASSVSGITGSLGGLELEERMKYSEEKRGERGESDAASTTRERYSEYRGKY